MAWGEALLGGTTPLCTMETQQAGKQTEVMDEAERIRAHILVQVKRGAGGARGGGTGRQAKTCASRLAAQLAG